MRRFGLLMLAVIAGLPGCVANFSLVAPGPVAVQDLHVQAGDGWNKAPGIRTASARKGAETWTKDGMLLDRLVIIPGIPDGEPLLVSRDKSAALPVFRADMLPNEIEELIESTILKVFGEGQSVVSTGNLRPHRYGSNAGVMFDLTATVTESPEYRGTAGAFIVDDKLYLMYFLGAVPHYYDKHLSEAEAIIGSASL